MSAHRLAVALRAAYLAMHRRTEAVMSQCGITADQFVLLLTLSRGRALTQRELVERTGSDANTLRAMLVLLEDKGYVSRKPHPTDGRARSVALTRKGHSVVKQSWELSNPLRDEMLEPFTERQMDTLIKMLKRLASKLSPQAQTKDGSIPAAVSEGKAARRPQSGSNQKSSSRRTP